MKLSRLSLVAKNGIDRLRAQGIEPDLDDVITLNDLGRSLERPEGLPSLSVLGNPVVAGNAVLWPWSIGAERWYNQRAASWFSCFPDFTILALAYSHAMARNPGFLASIITMEQAKAEIQSWVMTSNATREEIVDALDKLQAAPGPKKGDVYCPECRQRWHEKEEREEEFSSVPDSLNDSEFFDLLAILVKTFPGTTFEYWTWTTPQALTLRLLSQTIRRESMAGTLDSRSPQMVATHAFETGIRAIRDKHLAAKKRAKAAKDAQEEAGRAEASQAYEVLGETYKAAEAQMEGEFPNVK